MSLTTKDKQKLKAQAHKLKPIVFIGNNGLTENVSKEVNRALNDHELIKMRVMHEDREAKRQLFVDVCEANEAELVQVIGNIGILYRKNKDKR
jgi:RNA-binding protein